MKLHYAEAQETAFPYAKAKIAGPFEDGLTALAAARRLRPLYPDCNVRPISVNVAMREGARLLGNPKIEERTA